MEDLLGGHTSNSKQTSAHKIKVDRSINRSLDNDITAEGYQATRDEDSIDEMGNALKDPSRAD